MVAATDAVGSAQSSSGGKRGSVRDVAQDFEPGKETDCASEERGEAAGSISDGSDQKKTRSGGHCE